MNEINNDDEINDELKVDEVKNVLHVDRCESWNEMLIISNISIEFKLDSGSEVNILPYNEFLKLKPRPLLSKYNHNIKAYSGYKVYCISS